MEDKIKQQIGELLMQQSQLKLLLRNLSVMQQLTDEMESKILDRIAELESIIENLK